MPYRDDPVRSAPHGGRGSAAYRAACFEVRERVRLGARCWFWRKPGHEACPGKIDLRLRSNARWAFTAHHLHRLMDGGAAVVRAQDMAPAHRACNARDGLMAQNARRSARRGTGRAVRAGLNASAQVVVRGGISGGVVAQSSTCTHSDIGSDRVSRPW